MMQSEMGTSPPCMSPLPEFEKMDMESMRVVVVSINRFVQEFLASPCSRAKLRAACVSMFGRNGRDEVENEDEDDYFVEFSDGSALSNLYRGIDGIEAVVRAKWPEERTSRLLDAERMLQVPALLDGHGVTTGTENGHLISVSYFYLSMVKKLQKDDWQVAMHFLQALLVSPRMAREVVAPDLCEFLFRSIATPKGGINEEESCAAMKEVARKYKGWLMYYQVMLYGETPRWLPDESDFLEDAKSTSGKCSGFDEIEDCLPVDSCKGDFSNYAQVLVNAIPNTQVKVENIYQNTRIERLCDVLEEPESDSPFGFEEDNSQKYPISTSSKAICKRTLSLSQQHQRYEKVSGVDISKMVSGKFSRSVREVGFHHERDSELFHQITATSQPKRKSSNFRSYSTRYQKSPEYDLMGIFEEAVSKLCLSEGVRRLDEEFVLEITALYEMLNSKTGMKLNMLRDVLLEKLLKAISTSKEDKVIRLSVSILASIASENNSVLCDIKKKGLRLGDLASALKRNVHEAAVLIYLIKPSPNEIMTLELLPTLVEVVCTWSSYKLKSTTRFILTPPVASLMIIEVLVTAFDNATSSTHLEALNSPRVLHELLDVARDSGIEESISLATIIVKCMQFDGQCRSYVSQVTPVAPFISLLQSNQTRAKSIALEFFHEILCMPRSSAIALLRRVQTEGGGSLATILMHGLQHLQPHAQLFAANLWIQLDILENSSGSSAHREEAMKVLIESLESEDDPTRQQLSSFILANLGGTYAWTGEPYTVAWLVKKQGVVSPVHQNLIKDFDWQDQCLSDVETDPWSTKVARNMIASGKIVFKALEKGLNSKTKRVSRDSLTVAAWIGCEIVRATHNQRYLACEILLDALEQFLHPGVDLEERLLGCLCIYSYTSGKGKQKLVNFSEGVRESLRRFSSITWMAEELHRVADYYLPNKSRISCVHTQTLEAGNSSCGAVNALIYYKGLLCSGHSDGSIKMWEIRGQSATLVLDKKEHNKEVTCLSLLHHGDSLLSGSADKTIRVWRMVRRKLECLEVISTKDPIRNVDSCGQLIFVITQAPGIKVIDSSRKVKEICKKKKVKSMAVVHGKIYAGCKDSSIQEIAFANNREREIKAPSKIWTMQKKPINSIIGYKDWIYAASTVIEGSNIKEWRRNHEAEIKITSRGGGSVAGMAVVEDFLYLNYSSSASILQIWLRGTQQKVGRISAGSKITSLLAANDVIICGTEAGLIKGWIPL
ncbi:hypothetical protein MLD38_020536 [Melastoma candidum]|uniref:Uncharacterized protein n=1 Tax=Melastoma candidum TaxID=119954 RepID=A0ACB9QG90_9MYRT|nr:hypothetical protein MLD38_020536 [Melastoma candidum]